MADKPIRLGRRSHSIEVGKGVVWWIIVGRVLLWMFRRLKPILYHPIAWPGIVLVCWALTVSVMFAAYLLLAGMIGCTIWYAWAPDNFAKHAKPRLLGFVYGFYYRFRIRPKLTECHVLAPSNPPPTISRVRVHGPIHRIWIKKSWGDDTELWRSWATNIADTYNAGDAKINRYRPPKLTGWRLHTDNGRIGLRHSGEMVDKWRWLEIEFMHKNPFSKVVHYQFIDYYRDPVLALTEGNPVGKRRDGTPYRLNVERHLVVFAMTQWGKSNALRTMIYASKDEVAEGRRENWMIDLKRGVAAKPLEGQLARHEYGLEGPAKVLQFVMECLTIVDHRLDQMRAAGAENYTEIEGLRRIDFYVDEWLAFEEPAYAKVKAEIYKAFGGMLNRAAAAGVFIYAFTQQPKKDKFELRDHFNEVWVGAMKTRAQVEMAMGNEAWERGAKADDLPMDLRGVFYVEIEQGRVPEDIRVALTPIKIVQDLPQCPASSEWPLRFLPTSPPMPEGSLTAQPADPERELVGSASGTPRLTDL